MSKFISKLGIIRLCLMSFILFNLVFTCENAFSRPWQNNMEVSYNPKDGSITFLFLYYDYDSSSNVTSYLSFCSLKYTDDANIFTNLIITNTQKQSVNGIMWMKIGKVKPNDLIEFPNMKKRSNILSKFVGCEMTDARYQNGNNKISSRNAYMVIKWTLPKSIKTIKNIQFEGTWTVNDPSAEKSTVNKSLYKIFQLNIDKLRSNAMKKSSSILKTEISNNVTVTAEIDAINVTGAEPGENIKVFTASGVELKSVVAKDDIVNIKLAKNQKYIIKIGEARYKIAL